MTSILHRQLLKTERQLKASRKDIKQLREENAALRKIVGKFERKAPAHRIVLIGNNNQLAIGPQASNQPGRIGDGDSVRHTRFWGIVGVGATILMTIIQIVITWWKPC